MSRHVLKPARVARTLFAAAVLIAAGSAFVNAQWWESERNEQVQVWPIKGNIYLIRGAGANIAASVGRDGALLVDTGTQERAEDVLAAVKKIQKYVNTVRPPLGYAAETRSSITFNSVEPPKPIRYIINTTLHPEHVGGNARISVEGTTISGGNVGAYAPDGAAIYAHENVLLKMSAIEPRVPDEMLPTDVFRSPQYKLSNFFNGEGVLMIDAPKARTDGDIMVYFRGSDVLATGDVFRNDIYPVIDLDNGGSIQGIIDGLNHILDIAIAEFRTEGGTMIVPGHGRVGDSADVAYYRDMVTVIRDRVQWMIDKGSSLDQIKTAELTIDYDGRWGSETGPWTTSMFIEAVYKSLMEEREARGN